MIAKGISKSGKKLGLEDHRSKLVSAFFKLLDEIPGVHGPCVSCACAIFNVT